MVEQITITKDGLFKERRITDERIVTYGSIIFVMLMVWIIGFFVMIGLDSYTDKKRKKLFVAIIVLVFFHIMQNYIEYFLIKYYPASTLRTVVSVFGYSIRPAILVLFAYLISPKGNNPVAWGLVGLNAIMHTTAFYSGIVFKSKTIYSSKVLCITGAWLRVYYSWGICFI